VRRAAAHLAAAVALAGCSVGDVDFSGRECPCDIGWTCDMARNLCFDGLFQEGLLLWYPLDEGVVTAARDATLRGLDAVCSGPCPEQIEGRTGRALVLDGAMQHLRVEDDPELRTPDGLSIAVFLRIERATRGAIVARPRPDEQPGATGWALELDGAGRAAFATWDGTSEHRLWTDVGSLHERAWMHVAGTWDGGTKRLWLDGVEVAQAGADVAALDGEILLGGDASSESLLPLDGAVDDVRIYGRALDATELDALVSQ
jgi:hypothetical protein